MSFIDSDRQDYYFLFPIPNNSSDETTQIISELIRVIDIYSSINTNLKRRRHTRYSVLFCLRLDSAILLN